MGDLRNLQDLSGLTERERQWRLGDIDTLGRPGTASMVSACQQILAQPSGLLTLWGPCGNGKSMALQAIVNEVIERRIRALYLTMTDLLGHLREAMDPTPEGRLGSLTQRRKRLAEIPVLALDEFDKRNDTPWVREQVTDLIERRHRLGEAGTHATLIAMNEDPARELPWISSRLLAGCNRVVHNDDSDLRSALTS